MKNYLFLFTIGPVQSFISQARKTQDLFAGSKLLTNLIDSTIKELKETGKNVKVIFPHYKENENDKNYPNRFVAKIEKIDSKEIEKIGNQLETKVKSRFKENAEEIFNQNVNKNITKPNDFYNQIDNLLTVYWVAEEYSDNYKKSYDKLEQLLGSIKNARKFNQLGETGRKCSLCGERNALFYNGNKKPTYLQKDAVKIDDRKLNKGESLCAVCFTKRFYKTKSFPSTAEIATMNTIDILQKEIPYNFQGKFENVLANDSQLIYLENIENELQNKDSDFPEHILEEFRKELNKSCKNQKLKLNKYYAIIMSDGDNMGNWLSGKYLPDITKLEDFHNKFSERLGSFTKQAKDYLNKENRGETVYAGGDDFLGFVNLESLFDLLQELRNLFDSEVNAKLREEFNLEKEITLSAGVVIAHYKTPLHIVLDWARKMEHSAKEKAGRNAFAMAVLKHSGEIHQTHWKWKSDTKFRVELIKDIINKMLSDNFSTSFITNIQAEFNKLKDKKGRIEDINILEAELTRLLDRSCNLSSKVKQIKVNESMGKFKNFINESGENIDNFFNLLNIIKFLLKESNNMEVK